MALVDPEVLRDKLNKSSTFISKYFRDYKAFFDNKQVPDERGLTDLLLFHSIIDCNLPVKIHKLSSAEEAAAGLDFDLVYTTAKGKRCICLQAKSFKPTTSGGAVADFTYHSENQDNNQLTQLKIYIDTLSKWGKAQDEEIMGEAVKLLKEAAQLRKAAAQLQNADKVEEEELPEEQIREEATKMVKKAVEKIKTAKDLQDQASPTMLHLMSGEFDVITGGYVVFGEEQIVYIPMDGDEGLWRNYDDLLSKNSKNVNAELNKELANHGKLKFFPLAAMIPED
ncbi:hypothetical protein DL93DRAFT_2103212 [Clavulina sp. PMI_390]|nr:hypothetical protein DL93DRAFT_2103212 [Clavulina sp. PMI_390]